MSSKILSFVKNMNRPLEKFVIRNGWNLRLANKKIRGAHFKKLSKNEKADVKKFWRQYGKRVSPAWASYYAHAKDSFDPRYIPESLYYSEMIGKLGDLRLGALGDKNVQKRIFSSKQANTVFHKNGNIYTSGDYRRISLEEAIILCEKQNEVVIKPTAGSYGGRGVAFWMKGNDEAELHAALRFHHSMIVQEVVQSHPFFRDIHPHSLNTLRLVTLIAEGEPILLSTILRMGQGGQRTDNSSAGGLIAVVDQNGCLQETAIQRNQEIISQHPGGFVFRDKTIPNFQKILDDVFTQCMRIPSFRMVFWDYTVDIEGDPVLIEANLPSGQIDSHQFNIGPIFGDRTEKVLSYMYKGTPL